MLSLSRPLTTWGQESHGTPPRSPPKNQVGLSPPPPKIQVLNSKEWSLSDLSQEFSIREQCCQNFWIINRLSTLLYSQIANLYTVSIYLHCDFLVYSGGILSPYFVMFTSCLSLHSVCIYSVALYFQWRNPITLFCRRSDSRPTSCPHPPSSWHGQTRLWDWTRWYRITGSTPYDTGSNRTVPRKTAGQWLYVSSYWLCIVQCCFWSDSSKRKVPNWH